MIKIHKLNFNILKLLIFINSVTDQYISNYIFNLRSLINAMIITSLILYALFVRTCFSWYVNHITITILTFEC